MFSPSTIPTIFPLASYSNFWLDWDETKGVHFNIEDYSKGKGSNAIKIAIPINISRKQYEKIIDLYNKGLNNIDINKIKDKVEVFIKLYRGENK